MIETKIQGLSYRTQLSALKFKIKTKNKTKRNSNAKFKNRVVLARKGRWQRTNSKTFRSRIMHK